MFMICFAVMSSFSYAAKHVVMVSGTELSPDTLTNVNVGDTIQWKYVNDGAGHTMFFTSTPAGSSPITFTLSETDSVYEYKIVYKGEYEYTCYPHGFFAGYFNAKDPLGISENIPAFSLYPNPASKEVFLSIPESSEPVTLLMHAADGKKVKEEVIGSISQSINVAGLPQGVYIIELTAADMRLGRKRIVIQ